MNTSVILKPGRERSVIKRHPWLFSGAVQEVEGNPESGETITIRDAKGVFLATGAYSPSSQIRVRIWSWDKNEIIDSEFFSKRLKFAISRRKQIIDDPSTTAYRLVHAESDGIPGLVIDKFNQVLVVQFMSAGVERYRNYILDVLEELLNPDGIFERSDVEVRKLEGLPLQSGAIRGQLDELLEIQENHLRFIVDIKTGHKTGFYLDQRDNRSEIVGLAEGKRVLDCFSYTGGFTVAALKGDAVSVDAVDVSAEACAIAEKNIELNNLDRSRVNFHVEDVFQFLRKKRDQNRKYDLIILDPPKFAPTASHVKKAARGYKDINLLAMKLLNPGGYLATFSCSGGVSQELFQKILFDASIDAGVDARIIKTLHQGEDHPVALSFPEGKYLKGFILEVS